MESPYLILSGLAIRSAVPLIYLPLQPFGPHPHLLSECLLLKSSTAKTVLSTPPQTVSPSGNRTPLSALAPSAPSFSRVCTDPHEHLIWLTTSSLDFHHIDLLAHFDRERIPERVVRSLHRSIRLYSLFTLITLGPCQGCWCAWLL